MKGTLTILIVSFCLATLVFAQESKATKYELRGVIRDQNAAVIPELSLKFRKDAEEISSYTDVDGEFSVQLSKGDYVMTADTLSPDKFRAFIRIIDLGLNPDYLEFLVDSEAIVCLGSRRKSSPKVISSSEPPYPPAAKAVRASGDVSIGVKILPNGRVSTAKAVTGHPLLRRVSEMAAEEFIFESADGMAEREAIITFVFNFPDKKPKEGLKRFSCPYRVSIYSSPDIINTRNY